MRPARKAERLEARPCLSPEEEAAVLERLVREEGEPFHGPLPQVPNDPASIVVEPPRGVGLSDALYRTAGEMRRASPDYDRFLGMAQEHAAAIGRIAERLLAEKKIGQGLHDALACAAWEMLHDAYQAGRCEPQGVTDLHAELRRVGHA